ncbi:glycosyltransferase [Pantoea sp.]|uniref:glycosyltransferase n=1 Tax=Pantoea sp. TaxID=69393 RepID=UPI0028A1DECD|nr:glycosyltransferase [Pantoea sp.]
MNVGITNTLYPERRNILINPENNYINLKTRNLFYYVNPLRQRLLHKNKCFAFLPLPLITSGTPEIFHLFNEVAITRRKWVATFETELPRVLPVAGVAKQDNPELHQLTSHVLKDNCLGLIAISDSALHMQKKLFSKTPAIAERIAAKTLVMHPPQTLFRQQKPAKKDDILRLVFVGNEFYRKGGAEVVLAISQLLLEGALSEDRLEVHLIGDMSKHHNVAHRQFQDAASFYRNIELAITRHRCFRHQQSMANDALLALFARSDVGLLPTWQETYGFSVLEMQASGCPVITSNVRALPEINPASAGWLLEQPLDDDREFAVNSPEQRERVRHGLIEQLKSTLLAIVAHPGQLQEKGEGAIRRIREHHDPLSYRLRLNEIYQRGVTGVKATVSQAVAP